MALEADLQTFRSSDLQKNLKSVLASAEFQPTVLVNRGQPRAVLMSTEEYRRLKTAAGEPVPSAAMPRRPLVLQGVNADPLGYDTSDIRSVARHMADDALSGRTAGRSKPREPRSVSASAWPTQTAHLGCDRGFQAPPFDPEQRAALRDWFSANANRILIQPTAQGADYQREMRNWLGAGSVAADRPTWRGRGEASIAEVVPLAASVVAAGDTLVLLVDDRAARAVLVAAVQTHLLDADIMGTQTFLAMLERDFHIIEAGTAWQAIGIAADRDIPVPYNPDPIIVRPSKR